MAETRRMAEETTKRGEEVQERVQSGFESGFEAASRSLSEANRGFQAMADELTDFSKSRWEAVFQAWEQLLRVRHLGDVVEVQTRYAQRAYDAYMSEMSKLGEMYLGTARNAANPVKDTRRFS